MSTALFGIPIGLTWMTQQTRPKFIQPPHAATSLFTYTKVVFAVLLCDGIITYSINDHADVSISAVVLRMLENILGEIGGPHLHRLLVPTNRRASTFRRA